MWKQNKLLLKAQIPWLTDLSIESELKRPRRTDSAFAVYLSRKYLPSEDWFRNIFFFCSHPRHSHDYFFSSSLESSGRKTEKRKRREWKQEFVIVCATLKLFTFVASPFIFYSCEAHYFFFLLSLTDNFLIDFPVDCISNFDFHFKLRWLCQSSNIPVYQPHKYCLTLL